MKINVAAKTDPGLLHDHNEDYFALLRKAGLFLVADGVGGADAGELASTLWVSSRMETSPSGVKSVKSSARSLSISARNFRSKEGRLRRRVIKGKFPR